MLNKILQVIYDASLSKNKGRYLSDKSYGFDVVYFISKFILYNRKNNIFDRRELRQKAISYIEDIFQLTTGTAGAINYFIEVTNLLEFSNIIIKVDRNKYKIVQEDILKYITENFENAYIFLYLVTYKTFKNDMLWDDYVSYCMVNDVDEKKHIIMNLYHKFCESSVSIRKEDSNWSKQLLKYSLLILGYVNDSNLITRELHIKESSPCIRDIALNVEGTRTPIYLPKKNDYLNTFNKNYVCRKLGGFAIKSFDNFRDISAISDSISSSLADLKLLLLDDNAFKYLSEYDKEQYVTNLVKSRNPTIQRQFKKGLLENDEHICPICGYCFEELLIASHIKPYSKCDDTYDAINYHNGFLMCPNHDRLFEGAKHMTIDARTGLIILSDEAAKSVDYRDLKGKYISRKYIENERRHYLKWHNERFMVVNSIV